MTVQSEVKSLDADDSAQVEIIVETNAYDKAPFQHLERTKMSRSLASYPAHKPRVSSELSSKNSSNNISAVQHEQGSSSQSPSWNSTRTILSDSLEPLELPFDISDPMCTQCLSSKDKYFYDTCGGR